MTEITPIDFVRLIYGDQFPGFLSLWSKQTRKTRFYSADDMHLLESDIGALVGSEDLYLALGTQVERLPETERGGADTVVALPGFVADIDFAAAKSSAKAYPTDVEEARAILGSFPFEPSIIIETGNGLHVHFLLDQLHVLDTPQDREQASRLWTAFQRKLIAHFREHGRDIDSVGDLPRNYRIAATDNHKSDPPKPVRALAIADDQRFSLSAIREFVADVLDPVSLGDATSGDREYPPADHDAIVAGCAWYRNVAVGGAATCDEPNWHAAASITSRCKDGEDVFHEFSQKHPKYSRRETSQKFKRASESAGPRTCRTIEFELGHRDCADCPFHGRITSPIQLGHKRSLIYDPGQEGPVPLGYLPDGQFVFFEQTRRILIVETSNRLINAGTLLNLAPADFWLKGFPKGKGDIDARKAGTALMQACRDRGGFDEGRVRGRGVYVDRDKVVRNFGDQIPDSADYTYVCHLPLTMDGDDRHVDPAEVLAFFRLFNFADPSAAYLLLGWMASAVICGALSWRTHVFVTGAKNTGKTTLVNTIRSLLDKVVVALDGQSTEAGIRQKLGPDSRPVILDEFESDQNIGRMKQVIKLLRSSSSGDLSVARGTPEGKALVFSIRSSFLLAAINAMSVTAADRSRIVSLGLIKHDNDKERARQIAKARQHLGGRSASWCLQAIDKTVEILASIATLQRVFPPCDSRHATNVSTLLGAAWTMLNGRAIDEASAEALIEEHWSFIQELAEAHEGDDAEECLKALLEFRIREREEDRLLGHILSDIKRMSSSGRSKGVEGTSLTVNKGLVERYGLKWEETGLVVANSHRGLAEVFKGTQWEAGNWGDSLKRLPGATKTAQRRFSEGVRSLGTLIPADLIPDRDEVELPF